MLLIPLNTWRWTVEKYDRAAALGFFDDQRVELIEGRIVKMPPQSEPHVAGVSRALWALSRAFGAGYFVRPPAPLRQGPRSKPEPDVAVVPGTAEDYLRLGTPSAALLVVEVSDTTLWYDRNRKASLYARYDIRDYWIVNLVDRQMEIYRDPVADATHKYGCRYNNKAILKPPADISPLAKPDAKIAVAEFLP